MTLYRNVLVSKERLRDEIQKLTGSYWPGGLSQDGREVPANQNIRCRAIRGQEQNGMILLECTYEG